MQLLVHDCASKSGQHAERTSGSLASKQQAMKKLLILSGNPRL
jgi:hypothetical protein